MSYCCSTPSTTERSKPSRYECPVNGNDYPEVPLHTVLQHIDKPWLHTLKKQKYFYCDAPDCDVVYFAEDNTVIDKSLVRTRIGTKESSDSDALICYCFGVSNMEAMTQPEAKAFVIQQTREKHCSCTTSNPSGRCCLKDFPEHNK
jgi:hypothetical protein